MRLPSVRISTATSAAVPAITTLSRRLRPRPRPAPALKKGGAQMAHEGIGARVPRKEDRRFITGQGNYTDDIPVKNAAYAEFVRSPYAHARIVRVDASAARGAPGVIGVLSGAELADDKVGGLICGWMIH